jgi:hypothetical protein
VLEIAALALADAVIVTHVLPTALGARVTSRQRADAGTKVRRSEALRDSRGQIIDDPYVEGTVDNALEHVRGRGCPSLSRTGKSPLLRVRVSRGLETAVREAARQLRRIRVGLRTANP